MEKSQIYFRVKLILKSLLLVLFTGVICLSAYFVFFLNKNQRFKIAEDLQGTYFSQFMFKVLAIQFPNYSNVYHEQSVAFNKRGLYNEGFKLLNKAVLLNPKEHLGYRGWMKLNKLKDYKGAIVDFERLNKLTPDKVNVVQGESINYLLAISYQGLGDFDKSKEYYHTFFKTSDSSMLSLNSIAYVNYGILLEKFNLNNEAIKQYDKSLKGHFKFSEAFFHKAEIFEKLNRKDSARYYYQESLNQYEGGYRFKDVYNEVFNELYKQDILNRLEKL